MNGIFRKGNMCYRFRKENISEKHKFIQLTKRKNFEETKVSSICEILQILRYMDQKLFSLPF